MNGRINNNNTNDILIQCPCCLFQFDSLQWLIGHLREIKTVCYCADEEKNQLFICKICFLNLQTSNELADHLERFHDNNNQQLQQVQLKNVVNNNTNNLQNIQQSAINNNNYRQDQTQLIIETKYHNEITQNHQYNNQCKYCTKSFKRNTDLQRHELIHTGERPFTCPKCFHSFRTKQTLETHLKTHSKINNEQFQCCFCQKNFLSRSSLKLHFRIHTGEAPFKCQNVECLQMFRTKKLMLTHYKNCHQFINQEENNQLNKNIIDVLPQEEEQLFALNGLLELNKKIGGGNGLKNNGRKSLVLSKNSAFDEFEINKKLSFDEERGRKRRRASDSVYSVDEHFELESESLGTATQQRIKNISSVPLYIDHNRLINSTQSQQQQQQNYCGNSTAMVVEQIQQHQQECIQQQQHIQQVQQVQQISHQQQLQQQQQEFIHQQQQLQQVQQQQQQVQQVQVVQQQHQKIHQNQQQRFCSNNDLLFNFEHNINTNLNNFNKFNYSNSSNISTISTNFFNDAEYSRDGQVHHYHNNNNFYQHHHQHAQNQPATQQPSSQLLYRSLTPIIYYNYNINDDIDDQNNANNNNMEQNQQQLLENDELFSQI